MAPCGKPRTIPAACLVVALRAERECTSTLLDDLARSTRALTGAKADNLLALVKDNFPIVERGTRRYVLEGERSYASTKVTWPRGAVLTHCAHLN